MLNSGDPVSFDGCAVNEAVVIEAKEDGSDSQDGFETGDDWEIDFSEPIIVMIMDKVMTTVMTALKTQF